MLKEIIFILIYATISLQQLQYNCMERELQFDTHLYLSSPNFPKSLKVEERQNCFFEFQNPSPIMLIFTNAYLCNVMVKTAENTTEIEILDTNTGYHQFHSTFLSMRLSSAFNETDPKCEWQAFQAFAYDPNCDFAGSFSDIVDKDNIFALSTLKNNFEPWSLWNDANSSTNVKMVLRSYFGNKQDVIKICFNTDDSCADKFDRPQLNYFVEEAVMSEDEITLEYNKDFGQNSWFHFFAAVATKKIDWNLNCKFQQLNANHWIFSLYDVNQGYPHNTYCRKLLNKSEGYQYKLWFEKYHVELYFDNVAVDTPNIDDDPITLRNSVYVAPYTDFVIKFDSDGSINQAGFILHIEKYACNCGENILIIPCDGSKKRRHFMNSDDPLLLCEMTCTFQIKLEDNCLFNYLEIYYQYSDLTYLMTVLNFYFTNDLFFPLKNHKLVYYHDPLSNYSIAESIDYSSVSDVANFQFWVEFSVPLDMKMVTIVLNSTNWIFYEKLSNLQKTMVNIELGSDCQNKNYTIDFFVALTNDAILYHLNIYQNSTKKYIGRFTTLLTMKPDNLMPDLTSWQDPFSFHYENFNPGEDGLAFVRIRELDTQNCMFIQNVVAFKAFNNRSFVFTMINNGTGLCKSTFLNIWTNDSHGFQDFWTTSKENVWILDSDGKTILEFNQRNASKIPRLILKDIFYEVFLPSNSSVTFQGFREE